jgi:LuxR family transcriptional regulator, maltose regulon positive regulatory protein
LWTEPPRTRRRRSWPFATGGLDLAESDGLLFPFLLHPVPELLERQARQRTAHPALIRKIISALGGRTPAAPAAGPPEHLLEPLSQAETRVLRFLQTSLSAPEIARELYVSVNTVRTHMRHLYDKLGAHRRMEALDRGPYSWPARARPAKGLKHEATVSELNE